MRLHFKKFCVILFLHSHLIYADTTSRKNPETLREGNFFQPAAPQPGPLVGFGQNIIDEGQAQLFFFTDAFFGKNNFSTDDIPSFIYGIRNDLSFLLSVPFSPENKVGNYTSPFIVDIAGQMEYAFYKHQSSHESNQATILGAIVVPTQSISLASATRGRTKIPPTGYGVPTFFVGSTFNHTALEWFTFGALGVVIPLMKDGSKFGEELVYQGGYGRNMPSPKKWIFAWMIELDGVYLWKDKMNGHIYQNSGGTIIDLTPSLWFSSKHFIIQFGVGYPIVQALYGDQPKTFLSLDFNFGYTFF